jgi:hypothetical protein
MAKLPRKPHYHGMQEERIDMEARMNTGMRCI